MTRIQEAEPQDPEGKKSWRPSDEEGATRRTKKAALWEKRLLSREGKTTRRRRAEELTPRRPREAEQGTPPCFWRSVAQSDKDESRKPQIKLSRNQKREQRQMYQLAREPRNADSKGRPAVICTITGDFRQSQQEDLKLKHSWHQALNPDDHVPGAGANQKSLSTVTRDPGSGTAGSRREEELASLGRGGRDEEDEESGVVGEETALQRRRRQAKELTPRRPPEAEQGTPPRFW
ncbi:hypothetical protein NDU88_005569 [Pleurodeles waltl]|uniref:Uncharacterized protein n=1 Tax=Pleurodeles waltl TaxID=8319 RepID=A0AAV7NQS1_PLEWA|nr:hypothetical protein NDU88_005569 [Pleurodeles waltl]